ncbi:MAG: archaeal proteasome endopeptidase complex subunit alpha [Candidatus Brockarchaeota archaeon]|nr:archaeal proteasome endopeptidase complex subunit alpha [Candidatus Brockarchaeota archaeon]
MHGMFMPSGYDRAITVFSPEGRILQVEYATEMVNNSPTALGLVTKEGVVLAGLEKRLDALQDREFSQKLFVLDDHIGCVVAGFSSDARILVENARIEAQMNRLLYDEAIDIEFLIKRLSNIVQQYTQHAGVRPFGVSMIVGGVDQFAERLYQLDPSGVYGKFFATVVGIGKDEANAYFREAYRRDLTLKEGVAMAIEGLSKASKEKLEAERIRLATIPSQNPKLTNVSQEEIARFLDKVQQRGAG